MFTEEATSWLISCGSSILVELEFRVLFFVEGGKPESPEKKLRNKTRTNSKLNSHIAPGQNRTRVTLVRSEHSHQCAILASKELANEIKKEKLKGNSDGIEMVI